MIRSLMVAAVSLAVILVAGCGGSDDGGDEAPATSADASDTPVGTAGAASPTADMAPGRAVAANGYAVEQVFPHLDFEQMLALARVPGTEDDVVVLTQGGVAYLAQLTDDAGEPTVFLDIGDRMIAAPGYEEGLLGIAFPPEYEASRTVYINYTAGEPRRNVIAAFSVTEDAADLASEDVILEIGQPAANHNGGAMAFGSDGLLYIAVGDGGPGGDPRGEGQNTNTLLGSILRIDVSTRPYTIPDDNPFANGGGAAEIFAYGLRNPWRLSFDAETGDLWAGDVGQGEVEEIDLITRGGNYGWNIMEGTSCFAPPEGCDQSGLILPRAEYRHDEGCSVTGGYVYRGDAMPELDGWYIYGDFCSGRVWAFDTASETSAPVVLMDSEKSIASFAQDDDGEVYVVTYNAAIYAIRRAE